MGYYKGSLIQALLDLFPNIGLVKTKFMVLPSNSFNFNFFKFISLTNFFISLRSILAIIWKP